MRSRIMKGEIPGRENQKIILELGAFFSFSSFFLSRGWEMDETRWGEVRAKCHSCKAAYMHLHVLVRPINLRIVIDRHSDAKKKTSLQLPPQRWGRGHTTTYTIPTTSDLNEHELNQSSLWGQASDGPWSHHTITTSHPCNRCFTV